MTDDVERSSRELQNAIDLMKVETRIVELKGKVIAGRSLTADETKELADLEAATLRMKKP